ncbi:MAG: MerR family transcriptional regulator [Bacteroidaceae bacterium]|jgi:DNA-binding transcriptional MerR regulator|nr:MerR family transcriptional regulator [Bacteroidaceae bacterium]
MALNLHKDLKQYYSIHEVAEQFHVAESLLRFWEQEFPSLKPHKAGRNIRQYTKDDIELVGIIYNLVKVRGLKIAKAREMLKKNKSGAQNDGEAIERLQKIRQQLVDLRSSLNGLDMDLLPDDK